MLTQQRERADVLNLFHLIFQWFSVSFILPLTHTRILKSLYTCVLNFGINFLFWNDHLKWFRLFLFPEVYTYCISTYQENKADDHSPTSKTYLFISLITIWNYHIYLLLCVLSSCPTFSSCSLLFTTPRMVLALNRCSINIWLVN